jgi:hypothetical protein
MTVEENYFDKIPEDKKRDVAFNVVVSVRDAISLAQKKQVPPTYEQALKITHDIDEKLYNFCSQQLTKKNENDTVKLFKERADAETLKQGKSITATDLLQEEVKSYRELLITPNLPKEKTRFLNNHIASLEAAIENLKPRRLSEHRILERDFCKIDRTHLGAEKHFETDDYIDYKIANDRYLRVRLLHPDKPEHILGADLIYEQFSVETEKVRIAVLQYKTWDNGVLYFSQSNNIEAQLLKLKANLCDKDFCKQPAHLNGQLDYRFPYCCAYIRPTDKLQNSDSKMISQGIHIPVCSALQIKNDNGNKIEKNQVRHSTLTHEVFENLFNHSFIGSRWIAITELEEFYRDKKILEPDRSFKLYAKEIIGKKE